MYHGNSENWEVESPKLRKVKLQILRNSMVSDLVRNMYLPGQERVDRRLGNSSDSEVASP